MPIDLFNRAKNAWNAFVNNKDPTKYEKYDGVEYSYRPARAKFTRGNERSIVNAVYNRIAMDVAAVQIRHVRLDENDRYLETIDSNLNECFATEANIDQTGRSLVQDIVISMFDEGVVAVMPVVTDDDPDETGSFDVCSMRVAKIVAWKPQTVRVRAYDERDGREKEVELLKCNTLIIENPLYAIINEPNSTMQRLTRKLALLDNIDEQSGAGKLDLIIQLPYTVRSELRKQQAEERKKAIEQQLAGSKYGIAYIDSTEHITQLNRAVENNLMGQIEYLTNQVYAQLGITAEVMNGTADEKTMLNYNKRTIEPILSTICDEARRKWLTKTARSQRQSIMFFDQPLRLVPASQLADMADKFTRNEIMSSNEFRQILGMKKSDDPAADELRNKNLNQSSEEAAQDQGGGMGIPMLNYREGVSDGEAEEEMAEEPSEEELDDMADFETLNDVDEQLNLLDALLDTDEDDEVAKHDAFEEDIDQNDYLEHYVNPYYNPQKAAQYNHDYYMRHRQLKGGVQGSSSSDSAKEAAQNAYKKQREDLTEARKADIAAARNKMNSQIKSAQEEQSTNLSGISNKTKSDIKRLNEKKASMLSSSKEALTKKIETQKRQVKESIKAHANAAANAIKSINSVLSGKHVSKEDKLKARKQIAELRAANQKKREALQTMLKSSTALLGKQRTAESKKISSDSQERANDIRATGKSSSDSVRKSTKSEVQGYRDAGNQEVERIRKSYSEKSKALAESHKATMKQFKKTKKKS